LRLHPQFSAALLYDNLVQLDQISGNLIIGDSFEVEQIGIRHIIGRRGTAKCPAAYYQQNVRLLDQLVLDGKAGSGTT
jgi:hypothetical protein